jgi:hypothetical protein
MEFLNRQPRIVSRAGWRTDLWKFDDRSEKVATVIARYWSGKAFRDVYFAAKLMTSERMRGRLYTAACDLLDEPPADTAVARRVILKALRPP